MAQTYTPPARYGDENKGPYVIRRNMGQVFGTNGTQQPGVKYYFEGAPLGIYLRDSSRVSYTFAQVFHDSITPDTSYRVDMTIRSSKKVSPLVQTSAPGVANYYLRNVAAEQVPAYYRAIYPSIKPGIDLHFFGSTSGPKMAVVINPGTNPNTVKLTFNGQDSINVDWLGALRLYVKDHWVELRQGVAYQDNSGTIVPVNWTPTYVHQDSSAVVGFDFGTYDTSLPLVVEIGYPPFSLGGSADRDLAWSTYMGGPDDDEFTCVETDEVGDAYTCGHSFTQNFPINPGNAHYPPFQPEALGSDNAVIAKFKDSNKQLEWATFYGGAVAVGNGDGRTEARKLAPYTTGFVPDHEYVFVTGITNCTDFFQFARPGSIFNSAVNEAYLGGQSRMWVGGFKKLNGVRDWATTHGQTGGFDSREEGLTIAVDPYGKVAVGGRLFRTVGNVQAQPVFPLLTPSGAYTHTGGGAFVLSFNPDYTLRWATTVGSRHPDAAYTQITDMRYNETGRDLWFTGISCGTSPVTDLVTHPGGYNGSAGSVILGKFDMLGLTLAYCTRWGGGDYSPASIAYALDYDGTYLWMAGGTNRTSLSAADAPLPAGPSTIHHNLVNSTLYGNNCDGFIVKFNPKLYTIEYGTLFGGDWYDMITDVGHDGGNVYFTGETRSTTGIASDINPLRYYQPLNSNVSKRDAMLLAIRSGTTPPEMVWKTAFGGSQSERGWGIAGSMVEPGDVYLVGATGSQQVEAFPLLEFNITSPLDYYQDVNLLGAGGGGSLCSWYRFEQGLNFENGGLGYASTEPSHQGHDSFIASFAAYHPVGVDEVDGTINDMVVYPMLSEANWGVRLPHAGNWTVEVYNSVGQLVDSQPTQGTFTSIDLSKATAGVYVVRACCGTDAPRSAKLLRP